MGSATAWAFVAWLKITVGLAVAVGIVWLLLPAGSGGFTLAWLIAAVAELLVIRQLARTWTGQARHSTWWWPR